MATTLNVRVNGPLEEFIAENIGENGAYENASEYVRDLIRRDKQRVDAKRLEMLKAELQHGFGQPEGEYVQVDRGALLARIRRERA